MFEFRERKKIRERNGDRVNKKRKNSSLFVDSFALKNWKKLSKKLTEFQDKINDVQTSNELVK